jgi:hypothetical protein
MSDRIGSTRPLVNSSSNTDDNNARGGSSNAFIQAVAHRPRKAPGNRREAAHSRPAAHRRAAPIKARKPEPDPNADSTVRLSRRSGHESADEHRSGPHHHASRVQRNPPKLHLRHSLAPACPVLIVSTLGTGRFSLQRYGP